MINNIVLMGRLTADPELRTTAGGLNVTAFSIAVERSGTDPDGNRRTDFINIVAWRQTAEFICRYFKKGQQMALTGELHSRSYTDRSGAKRTAYEVVADAVSFCGSKNDGNRGTGEQRARGESGDRVPAGEDFKDGCYKSPGTTAADFEEIYIDDDFPL